MKKQIKTALVAIFGFIAISILIGCATGPQFGQPDALQREINQLASQYPIDIAGKKITISFEGDYWRGKVDGKDALAGDCKFESEDGVTIVTLNQSWAYIDTGKTLPTGAPVAKWQKTPAVEIVVEYSPPASFKVR